MTRNLYFKHSDGRVEVIAENISEDEVISTITNYIKRLNPRYKVYYVRTWDISDTSRKYDVGSWTEFFYWGYDGNDIEWDYCY